MKKEYATSLIFVGLLIGLFFVLYYFFDEDQQISSLKPNYEYCFDVSGTDSTTFYTIYDSQHTLIAEDITANQLDSVINSDNE
jgi:hypothetical protein